MPPTSSVLAESSGTLGRRYRYQVVIGAGVRGLAVASTEVYDEGEILLPRGLAIAAEAEQNLEFEDGRLRYRRVVVDEL